MTRSEILRRVREASEQGQVLTDEEMDGILASPEEEQPEWLRRYEELVVKAVAERRRGAMTKPWEEEWRAEHDPAINAWDLVCARDGTELAHRGNFLTMDDPGFDEARARLASAAPDMARVLLHLYENEPECVVCHEQVWWDDTTDTQVRPHTKDCALDAALRKAGVR